MKRILILGDINSPHIQKWASALIQNNFSIAVFSLSKSNTDWYKQLTGFQLIEAGNFSNTIFSGTTFGKLSYIKIVPQLRKAIKDFKPDIVHAHYATSYGLLGALSGFKPFFITVWGSDVYLFPEKSFLHKVLLKFNLSKADKLFSASKHMALQTSKYTNKKIEVVPFGINTLHFKPQLNQSIENVFIFGCIKKLEDIYGIEDLIHAFASVKTQSAIAVKLYLVGDGTQRKRYENLVSKLSLNNDVVFFGNINYNQVVKYHNMLHVGVYVSHSESFGVSILESCACGVPVVVSDVGGLPEVVEHNKTGLVVKSKDVDAIADAMLYFLNNSSIRNQFGESARQQVTKKYEWKVCLEKMINHYKSL